jgi:hypothetical protein
VSGLTNALVIGGAACVWDDLEALGEWDAVVFACNDAASVYPGRVDHFCTLHPEKLERWRRTRQDKGYNVDFEAHTHKRRALCGDVTLHTEWGGSSGLFCVTVALNLGFTRIVLCGVPMDARKHFDRSKDWVDAYHYQRHWLKRRDEFAPFTRSMSGWSRELLGPPDDEWLGRS